MKMTDLYEKYLLIRHQMRQESPDADDKLIDGLAMLALVNMSHKDKNLPIDKLIEEVKAVEEKLKKFQFSK